MINVGRILRDAKLFRSRLDQIDGAENTGSFLIQLVEAKTIASDPEPQPEVESTTQATPPSNTQTNGGGGEAS